MFIVPTKVSEAFINYKHLNSEIFKLVVKITDDLPLIVVPLAVLLIRRIRDKELKQKSDEENTQLIVSLEGKELENALYQAKTTTL